MVVEKVIIVSVHVHYFSFFSFFSLCLTGYVRLCRLHQVTSVYVGGTGRGARQYLGLSNDHPLTVRYKDPSSFYSYYHPYLCPSKVIYKTIIRMILIVGTGYTDNQMLNNRL